MNRAEYWAWMKMRRRNVGQVCEKWDDSFAAFLSDVGPRPSAAFKIGRENLNEPFSPGNAGWVPRNPVSTLSPEYQAWGHMRQRCENKNCKAFKFYGAKGVSVCERWRRSFAYFYSDLGPRPSPDHSLDRINASGNYEPNNCRWATREVQDNNRTNTPLMEINGTGKTVTQWERHSGLTRGTIRRRMSRGISGPSLLLPKGAI